MYTEIKIENENIENVSRMLSLHFEKDYYKVVSFELNLYYKFEITNPFISKIKTFKVTIKLNEMFTLSNTIILAIETNPIEGDEKEYEEEHTRLVSMIYEDVKAYRSRHPYRPISNTTTYISNNHSDKNKEDEGNSVVGYLLGFFLGIIGLVIALAIGKEKVISGAKKAVILNIIASILMGILIGILYACVMADFLDGLNGILNY